MCAIQNVVVNVWPMMIMYTPLYDYDQWLLCVIQNVVIVKISFSCDQRLLQQTTKITPMYLLQTHSTKKIKIQYNIKWKYHCHKILVWVFYLRWYKFWLSPEATMDLWSRVEFSSDGKQDTLNRRRCAAIIRE